jgi:hypothetical protein
MRAWACSGSRSVRAGGFDLSDGDQRQAYVAHFLEQAMQRGLLLDIRNVEGNVMMTHLHMWLLRW